MLIQSFNDIRRHQVISLKPIVVTVALLCTVHTNLYSANQSTDQIRELIRSRLENAGISPSIVIGNESIHAATLLSSFYERRTFMPAWLDEAGPLLQIDTFVEELHNADLEGLRASDYHLSLIEKILKKIKGQIVLQQAVEMETWTDLDLVLTDAFLIYASHLLSGKIDPESIHSEWIAKRREADLVVILENAIKESRVKETLQDLLPSHPGYWHMRRALARYRKITFNGGWPVVGDGPKLKKGDAGERVNALRQRLYLSGDLLSDTSISTEFFDDELDKAVRKFQKRTGLDIDGIVGPSTLYALNVPAEERMNQIEANMERWRWLPQHLGKKHIIINIASFNLDVVEDEIEVLSMRVIVGKEYRQTPVFSDRMTYLVIAPYWNIPPKIATKDKLPNIQKDIQYFKKEQIRAFRGYDNVRDEIDPMSINWLRVNEKNFKYRLRQDPGPNNALGKIKFMFPNKFDVYLHDTPSRELFSKTERTFSSGCIRIEKPIELAEYVLRGNLIWTRKAILEEIHKWKEKTIRLPEPIPIHLLYWTAWADDDGSIYFRKDIYGRDKRLLEAMYRQPAIYPDDTKLDVK